MGSIRARSMRRGATGGSSSFIYRGIYNPATTYNATDLVSYGGRLYMAKIASPGQLATETAIPSPNSANAAAWNLNWASTNQASFTATGAVLTTDTAATATTTALYKTPVPMHGLDMTVEMRQGANPSSSGWGIGAFDSSNSLVTTTGGSSGGGLERTGGYGLVGGTGGGTNVGHALVYLPTNNIRAVVDGSTAGAGTNMWRILFEYIRAGAGGSVYRATVWKNGAIFGLSPEFYGPSGGTVYPVISATRSTTAGTFSHEIMSSDLKVAPLNLTDWERVSA